MHLFDFLPDISVWSFGYCVSRRSARYFFFVGLRSSLITSLLVRGQETGNDYFYLNNVFDVSSPLLRENSA